MKYKWSMRKFWKSWFMRDIKCWYYTNIHGFNMGGFNGTLIPTTGETKYCSVKTRGQIIQIQHKHVDGLIDPKYDEVRIIPMKENHGIRIRRHAEDRNGTHRYKKDMMLLPRVKNVPPKTMASEIFPYIPGDKKNMAVWDKIQGEIFGNIKKEFDKKGIPMPTVEIDYSKTPIKKPKIITKK